MWECDAVGDIEFREFGLPNLHGYQSPQKFAVLAWIA